MENKGYMIFNAEGKPPKETLAVITSEDSNGWVDMQIIVNLTGHGVPMLFGALCKSMCEIEGVSKDLLRAIFEASISCKSVEDYTDKIAMINTLTKGIADEVRKAGVDLEQQESED